MWRLRSPLLPFSQFYLGPGFLGQGWFPPWHGWHPELWIEFFEKSLTGREKSSLILFRQLWFYANNPWVPFRASTATLSHIPAALAEGPPLAGVMAPARPGGQAGEPGSTPHVSLG